MSRPCQSCGVENRDTAKRCQACNQVLAPPPAAEPTPPPPPPPPRACPSGRHPMDPDWAICPYCEAERKARRDLEPAAHAPGVAREIPIPPAFSPGAPPAPPPGPSPRRPTQMLGEGAPARAVPPPARPVLSPASPSPRRVTVFAAPRDDSAAAGLDSTVVGGAVVPPPAVGAGRRIVAVLVTYTWRPEGQVFPLREGRNLVGRDHANEVSLDCDSHLSGRHAVILFHGKDFQIDDEKSMNGTFLDGVSVEEKQKLRNYARIRTGSTEWSFVRLEPTPDGVS